ncbi:MAG: discoidin domain-containing protein [Fimbriimonadaceae bacterium]|nr:discoidin domain-containing protein [Fimbriimonadaceae bacterium]
MFVPLLALASPVMPHRVAPAVVTTTLSQDTTIDRSKADVDFGRDTVLRGGPGLAVLLRFPQIDTPAGKSRRVTSAKLVLTPVSKDDPRLESVGRLTRDWDEGPDDGADTAKKPTATPAFAATWNSAWHGFEKWTTPGAADDAVAVSAKGALAGEEYVIDGLAEAVQWQLDHPGQNYGFRLTFSGSTAFLSHDFYEGKPKLVVEFGEPGADGPDLAVLAVEPAGDGWSATVANLGAAPAPAGKVAWRLGTESGTSDRAALSPGETATVALAAHPKAFAADPRLNRMTVSADCPGDTDLGNNETVVWTDGEPIVCTGGGPQELATAQSLVLAMNSYLLPMSRYSFAKDGGRVRFRVSTRPVADAAQVTLSATTNIRTLWRAFLETRYGPVFGKSGPEARPQVARDYRDDTHWLSLLPLPPLGFPEAVENPVALQASLGFSAPEVYLANASMGKTREQCLPLLQQVPTVLLIKLRDYQGQPLAGCDVDYVPAKDGVPDDAAALHLKTDANGIVRVSGRDDGAGKKNCFGHVAADGSNLFVQVRTKRGKTVESVWLPVWTLWQEVARGNKSVGTVEFRVNQSSGEIATDQDLAINKIVSDGAGSPPAQLVALVDGKPDTAFEIDTTSKPGWIEIDLGRDRPIGEVRLAFAKGSPPWQAFDIAVYGTAQPVASARTWLRETDLAAHKARVANDADGATTLTYRAQAVVGRYLRIIPRTPTKTSLTGVAVFPAILGN